MPTIVLFKTLVDMAHRAGLVGVTTELLQIPDPENGNVAIFRATVTMEVDGKTKLYQGTGDASPANVKPEMRHCTLRLAETRAVARALRIAVNVGEVADAELEGYEETDRPVARAARRSVADASAPMTEVQSACIEKLCRQRGEAAPAMEGWTMGQAAEAIRRLQTRAAQAA
jgi:hypothetical protein